MDSSRQRGKADLSTLVFIVVLAMVGWAVWKVGPVYYDHYSFQDKVQEICRTPKYQGANPEHIKDMLMREIRQSNLSDFVDASNFAVTMTDARRKIVLRYSREVEILPGWKHTFEFESSADEMLL